MPPKKRSLSTSSKPVTEGEKKIKVSSLKEFAISTAKKLKTACSVGRIHEVESLLIKHGYVGSDCFSKMSITTHEFLVSCATDAAKKGHLEAQCQIINHLLDLGIKPDFHLLDNVTLKCPNSILRKCLTSCSVSNKEFGIIAAHAYASDKKETFVLLVETFNAVVPSIWSPFIGAFVQRTDHHLLTSMLEISQSSAISSSSSLSSSLSASASASASATSATTTTNIIPNRKSNKMEMLKAVFKYWNSREDADYIFQEAENEVNRQKEVYKKNTNYGVSYRERMSHIQQYETALKVLQLGQQQAMNMQVIEQNKGGDKIQ